MRGAPGGGHCPPIALIDITTYLEERGARVDSYLDTVLPAASHAHGRLYEAVRYSIFAGGKRFRPALCIASCEAFGGLTEAALPAAAALELIHVSSLIHDDLPCMDDSDLRRGRPSCHRAFAESLAVLAGDWLLCFPFALVAEAGESAGVESARTLRLVRELAEAVCRAGIVEGQAEDLDAEARHISFEALRALHARKTGSLIRAAARCGLISAGVPLDDVVRFAAYAEPLGLAFQIADDILDVVSDESTLGKPVGADDANQKSTYVSCLGLEGAQEMAARVAVDAHRELDALPDWVDTRVLRALVDFVVDRRS